VVLGCTEYELAAQAIAAARPGVSLHGSAVAVAAQALRRAVGGSAVGGSAGAPLRVLLSGRPGDLPPAALRYREGRFLVRRPDRAPAGTGPGAGSSSIPA
jgi:glutamate racemase